MYDGQPSIFATLGSISFMIVKNSWFLSNIRNASIIAFFEGFLKIVREVYEVT